MFETSSIEKYLDQAVSLAIEYSPKLILALIVLFVGFWLIKRIVAVLSRALNSQGADNQLSYFLTNITGICLKGLLLLSVASMIGIETTSFLAIFGAAGLAIGLALQGSLSNLAGGVLLLIFKPYKMGDLVEAQGHLGVVKEIQLFNTILVDPNNKRVILPNGSVSNGSIINYSVEGTLRVDLEVGIAYKADIAKAKAIVSKLFADDSRVLDDGSAFVGVSALADSSVNLAIRPWCKVEDYWGVYFEMQENIKLAFDEQGIEIPFPQRDVHVLKEG